MGNEDIKTVDILVEFDKYTIQQVAHSLRRPGGRIPDPKPNAAPRATNTTPMFVFREKFHKRFLATCEMVLYYDTTVQGITTDNI